MAEMQIAARKNAMPRSTPAWFGGSMPAARLGVIINLIVPGAALISDALRHRLGANPVNFAIKTTGLTAVTYLVLSLAITPLKAITHLSWLVQFRRAIGCYAFYFAAAHLAIYFWWDRARSLSSTAYEISHRWYLAIGFTSLVLMLPLWMTSFNAAIQWLGGKKWKRLHRLAYLSAALGCYHFYLQSKADKRKPNIYLAVLGALLLWRLVAAVIDVARRPSKAVAMVSPSRARFWKGNLKVIGMFRETESVRTFRLAAMDGGPIPFLYKAGQFLNIIVPIEGQQVSRSYTIASSPTRDAYIELTVKREQGGKVSKYLHDMLMTGHPVTISAPAGRFTFDPDQARSLGYGVTLVAGGVGITPLISILRNLTDRVWLGQIDLLFIVRTKDDIVFEHELQYLASRHPNLRVHISITRDVPADWKGPCGRLSVEMIRKLIPNVAARPAFVCGPDAMATSARDILQAAGVPLERIKLESFTPAASVAKDGTANPGEEMDAAAIATVTFARSGQTAPLTAETTILEAAEAVGVSIDFQCRSGVCGTCRCKLLSGAVTMDVREALSESDEADGFILACQAKADADVEVDA